MTDEFKSLVKNDTWDLIDPPIKRKPIQNK